MKYELMAILSPKQTDKEIEKKLNEIKKILTDNGFTLTDEDIWGMRDLAYKIAGNTRGYYVVLNCTGEPSGMAAVTKDLTILPGLIRSMVVKMPDDYVLMRYEGALMMAKTLTPKTNTPAEALDKKVRSSKKKVEKAEPAEKTEGLDEKLKAIIEDKDIL